MVLITDSASSELRRILSYHGALSRQGVRLRVDEGGNLKMAIDVPHLGDAVIRHDKALLLIMDTSLSASLARRELDFCLPEGKTTKPEFTLRARPTELTAHAPAARSSP
jgi:Fe-S cluster assembly iron-binding protein IscA